MNIYSFVASNTRVQTINVAVSMCIQVNYLFDYLFAFRSKDDSANAVEGERFFLHANGSLEIHNVKREDDGEYTCVTENSEGKLAITAVLEVKGEI